MGRIKGRKRKSEMVWILLGIDRGNGVVMIDKVRRRRGKGG